MVGAKMMVSRRQLKVIFAIPVPILMSASPNRVKNENWKAICTSLENLVNKTARKFSPNEMKITFSLSLRLTHGHKFSASFRLAFDHEQLFEIAAPNMCVPRISDDVLRQIISQAGSEWRGPCVTAAPSPPRRFAAWRIEAPHFAVSPFGGPCVLRSV